MQNTIVAGYVRTTHSTGCIGSKVNTGSLAITIQQIRIHNAKWQAHLELNGVTIPDWVME